MRFSVTVILLPAIAAAEPTPIAKDQAVSEALAHNGELRAAREALGAFEAEVVRAKLLFPRNPEVEVTYGSDALSDGNGRRKLETELSQEIPLLGKRRVGVERTEIRLSEGKARVAGLALVVVRDAADAWSDLWRAQHLEALAGEALELNQSLFRAAERRFQAGDIPELERNLVELDVARARAGAAEARSSVARSAARLTRLMGRTTGVIVAAAGEPMPASPAGDLGALVARAAERRPELEAARLAEAGFDSELDLRRREIVPNPTVGVALEHEPARASEASRTLLFARVSFPIPVWDRKQAEIRAAESGRGVAAASRYAVERQVAAEVASAHAALAAARSSLEAFTGAVPKVERNLALLEKAYASGQVSLPELLAAKDRAFATRREIVEAQASLARAFHELRRAVGEGPSEATP